MTQARLIFVTDLIADAMEPERRVLEGCADVVALNAKQEDDLIGHIEDADAIMIYHTIVITRKTIERLRKCKLIVRCGVGYDNVDHAFARSRDIPVGNIPDYGTEEVADSAIGLMLALVRGIAYLNSRLRAGSGPWSHAQVVPLHRLRDQIFAVVGLGRIGTAAAVRAKVLGMDVVFYDPYKPDGYDRAMGVRRAEHLDLLLEQAFVLSLHCPLTDETHHLIDHKALEKMEDNRYLINTSRGSVVDTAVIPDAIAGGKLAGAGIDVLAQEPPAAPPDQDPLIAAWRDPQHPAHHRVIINPHAAFYCEQGLVDIRIKAAEACRRAIEGLPLRNIIN